MGTSYKIPENGANFGNLYEAAYKHTNNTTGGTMAAGHQLVWCQNGSGTSAIGTNIWTSGSVTASGKIQGAELEGTSLDINGNADISGNLTGVDAFTASGKIQGAELEGTSLDINGNGDVSGNLYVSRYFQSATGVPTNNLGTPTVTEMALFENQFKPQTTLANAYNNLADLTFFTRASGTSESDYSEVTKTDDQKRRFLRTHNSQCYIPNGANSYRIEFVAHNYTFANAMVAYWSSNSHQSKVQVYKRRCSDNAWIQHTSSNTQVSSWPGHLYLPFNTIPWHETNTSSTGHFNKIRIEFTPQWNSYSGSGTDYSGNDITLYGMQIWGGYPSGRRTVHSYDQNGKLNLFGDLNVPGNITTNGTVDGRDISGIPSSFAPTNATANSSDATLKSRANHTGTQAYSTITGTPTIPSGNQIIDWTSDRGSTNIHAGNYTDTNTTYTTATSSTLGLVKIGYGENGKNYPVELSSGKMFVNVPWANTQNENEEEADENTRGTVQLATATETSTGTDTTKATTPRGVKGAIDTIAVPIAGNKTITGTKTFSSTIVGSINGNSATTSERTISSSEVSAISTNTSKVGITTGSQTIAGSKTFSSPIKGQVIGIASNSSYINKTAAQFATDGTDKVYIGSNNYGWNDARDYATNFIDVDAPVLNQNDAHNGIICPVNLSQVSIMSQVRMNAADGAMQVRVYKMARPTGVNTSNLTLTQIATASVSTVNGRMTTLDATGSTAVSAGDLIIVGFGKTSGGNGQKPRINFTLTGTTV